MILIAHNIRSLHNVGSLFRSADAFGVERLYLTGFTATPPRSEIAKVALGAEDRVPWTQADDILALLAELRQAGYAIIALDNREGAEPIQTVAPQVEKVVLIVGNEVEGIESVVLGATDRIVEIPMPGRKRSLNVSVAAGIALFTFCQN